MNTRTIAHNKKLQEALNAAIALIDRQNEPSETDKGPDKQLRLKEATLKRIRLYKKNSRESYDEIINRLLDNPQDIERTNKIYDLASKLREKKTAFEQELNNVKSYRERLTKYRDDLEKAVKKNVWKNTKLPVPPAEYEEIVF